MNFVRFKSRLQGDNRENEKEFPALYLPTTTTSKNTESTFDMEPLTAVMSLESYLQDPIARATKHECCEVPECNKDASKRCSRCRVVMYCSLQCQAFDWEHHKKWCQNLHQAAIYLTFGRRTSQLAKNLTVFNKICSTNFHPDRVYITQEGKKAKATAPARPLLPCLLGAGGNDWESQLMLYELVKRGAQCTGTQWFHPPGVKVLDWLYRAGLKVSFHFKFKAQLDSKIILWLFNHGATYECVDYQELLNAFNHLSDPQTPNVVPRFNSSRSLLQETENDRRVILKAYVMTGGWIGRMVDHRELPSIENQKNSLFDLFMQSSSIGGVTQAEFWDWIKIRETKLVSLLHVVTDLLPPLALIVSDFYFGNDFNVVWEKNTRDHQTQKSSKEPALIQTRVTSQTRTIIRNLMRDCVYDMRDG